MTIQRSSGRWTMLNPFAPAFCPAGDREPGTVVRAGRRIRSRNDLVAEGPLPATSGRRLVSACVGSETRDSALT